SKNIGQNPINFGEVSNPTNFGNTINVKDFVNQLGLGSEVMDNYPTPIYAEHNSEEPGPLDSVVTLYKIARRTSDDFIINKIRDLEKRIKELEKNF
ncbi:46512_t:CDS:1, partial [Gigaspora margarita]